MASVTAVAGEKVLNYTIPGDTPSSSTHSILPSARKIFRTDRCHARSLANHAQRERRWKMYAFIGVVEWNYREMERFGQSTVSPQSSDASIEKRGQRQTGFC